MSLCQRPKERTALLSSHLAELLRQLPRAVGSIGLPRFPTSPHLKWSGVPYILPHLGGRCVKGRTSWDERLRQADKDVGVTASENIICFFQPMKYSRGQIKTQRNTLKSSITAFEARSNLLLLWAFTTLLRHCPGPALCPVTRSAWPCTCAAPAGLSHRVRRRQIHQGHRLG